jgi:hypothetical protein
LEGNDRALNAKIKISLSTLGKRVTVMLPEGKVSGTAETITDNESLVISAGRQRLEIRTEDLRWLRGRVTCLCLLEPTCRLLHLVLMTVQFD